MKHYRDFFRGKVVLCNCDDPRVSNFFKYFALNFEFLGLKKLITTCYANGLTKQASYLVYEGDKNGNLVPGPEEIGVHPLQGDGDFRSEECIELLKEADVVVTNPPFSLFREYVAQLIEYQKKFIIMGNNNAVTYKEIFPLIKEGKLWLGRTLFTGNMPFFKVPDEYSLENDRYEKREDGLFKQVNGVCWFTNVPNCSNKEQLIAFKEYYGNESEFPKYDNYDAINVDKMIYLPTDYYGVIGVPITALKYMWDDSTLHIEIDGKTEQFEIVGITENSNVVKHLYLPNCEKYDRGYVDGKRLYGRILIKRVS